MQQFSVPQLPMLSSAVDHDRGFFFSDMGTIVDWQRALNHFLEFLDLGLIEHDRRRDDLVHIVDEDEFEIITYVVRDLL